MTNTKLFHKPQLVKVVPFLLNNLAVCNPRKLHTGYGDLLAGRGDAHKLTQVRASERYADYDPVPFGDHLLDGEVDVGEGRAEPGDGFPGALGARLAVADQTVAAKLGCENLARQAQVPPVEDLLEETEHDGLVLLG